MIKIYTDGSCLGNPGKGGWAAIILDDGKKTELKGSKKVTTKQNGYTIGKKMDGKLQIKKRLVIKNFGQN